MKAVTAATMQNLDRRTIEDYGIPGLELMERAGAHVARIIKERFGNARENSALILAGKGNNGGDGFVVARLLAEAGWHVTLLLFAEAESLRGDALSNYTRLPSSVKQRNFQGLTTTDTRRLLENSTVILDALFGTGLTTGLSGVYADAVRLVNASGRPVVSVDIPSGVDATTGKTPGEAVQADITVTFGAAKIGQFTYPGAGYVGELIVTDIGIPAELLATAPFVEIIDREYAASLLQPRLKTAHKGSCGHCLVIAGSTGKSGAATMAANSAMRSGAGLVTLAVPASIHTVAEVKTTEVMTLPLAETAYGSIALEALGKVKELLAGRDTAAVGPGLGGHSETVALVREIISTATLPLVLDADALNALAGDLTPLKNSASPALVLTPHPGEMARLTGARITEVEADRLEAARSFAAANNCYLLLKGAGTVIAAPNGRLAINSSGNSGMASGGMGDVLTGVITALLGQGYEPFAACCLGAFCHGFAGDMAAAEKGEVGLIATDVQEMLPYAFKKLAGEVR
jgi:NAD(P)H-hydrate epimerase